MNWPTGPWGQQLSPEEGLAILRSPDDELLELLSAAYRVRRRWWGNQVRLNFLINAKSGSCGEDCGYCSQSRRLQDGRYRPLCLAAGRNRFSTAPGRPSSGKAKTYCIVTSGRGPGKRELDLVADVVPKIKQQYNLEICVSSGLLGQEQAQRLKQTRRRSREP